MEASRISVTARVAAIAGIAAIVAVWGVYEGGLAGWSESGSGVHRISMQSPTEHPYPLRNALPPAMPVESTEDAEPTQPPSALQREGPAPPEPAVAAATRASEVAPEQPAQATILPAETKRPEVFDIRQFGSGGTLDAKDVILATKPVILGRDRLGSVELAVGKGASVSIDRRELARLLGDRAPSLSASLERETGARVPLSALRTREVAIRYDPIADAVVIEANQ